MRTSVAVLSGFFGAGKTTLLSDYEPAAGPDVWRTFDDPLPEWDSSDLHDHATTPSVTSASAG